HQWIEIRTGVAIDHVLAGETKDEIGAGREDLVGAGVNLGFVAAQPEDFRADRLTRQRHPAEREHPLLAEALVEPVDLLRRSGVDAVEDSGTEWASIPIDGEHAGADGADGHSANVLAGETPAKQAPANLDDIAPPDRVGVVLRPTRAGQTQPVFDRLRR